MLRMRSFALAPAALLLAAAVATAAPPVFVTPPNTSHSPSGRDSVSPANHTASAASLLAASVAAAPPGFVAPANTYHYPSGRDLVSPANRTTANYFATPQSYYLHPNANAEPNSAPQYPPAQEGTFRFGAYGLDFPLVPRVLREPREPAPPTPAPAEIEVRVPAGAEIWFNGEKTTQTGTRRLFLSPELEPGNRYAYDVTARWTEDGKSVEQTIHVPLTAGARQKVTFR